MKILATDEFICRQHPHVAEKGCESCVLLAKMSSEAERIRLQRSRLLEDLKLAVKNGKLVIANLY